MPRIEPEISYSLGRVDKAEVLWVEQVRTLDDLAEGVALMRRHEISDEN